MTPVETFLAWAENDRNRSPHTLRRYAAVLASLPDPIGADLADVQAWWDARLHLSAATRSNDLACLRSFYRWATRHDLRADDPTRRLDAPRVPNKVPRPLGETELARLLVTLAESDPESRRAVALGAYAGLRVAEAAGLDWADIDQEARRIWVRGKGQKERVIGLSPVLLDKLLPETGGNVVTAGARPLSADALAKRVNRAMQASDIAHTFHDLRKRGATLALAKTGDVYAVSKAFGWASVETASAYAVVGDEALDRIAAAMV